MSGVLDQARQRFAAADLARRLEAGQGGPVAHVERPDPSDASRQGFIERERQLTAGQPAGGGGAGVEEARQRLAQKLIGGRGPTARAGVPRPRPRTPMFQVSGGGATAPGRVPNPDELVARLRRSRRSGNRYAAGLGGA